LFPDYV